MRYRYEIKKNAIKGSTTGILYLSIKTILGFISKIVFVRTLGIEYNGLNSLFFSIIQVLNLADLGVGSVLVYSLYKPIADGDEKKICALLRLYKVYYRIIGSIILIIGLLIIPIINVFINQDVPEDINIYIVYLMNLSVTVLSYWLFAYKNSLFDAHQQVFISNVLSIITTVIKSIIQIFVLLIYKNYYLYLTIEIVAQIAFNILVATKAKHLYPTYVPNGKLEKKEIVAINQKVKYIFWARLCGVITNYADNIVISTFLGLAILGKYNNYYYILSTIMMMFEKCFQSIRAGVGNLLITQDDSSNTIVLYRLTYAVSLLSAIVCSCLINVYQPFIGLAFGQKNVLDFRIVYLICLYFLSYIYPILWAVFKDAAGLWKEDRLRSIAGPLSNLIINLVLVQIIGLYGIIISTIISYLFISGPWLLYNVRKFALTFSLKDYIIKLCSHLTLIAISSFISMFLCGIVSKVIPNILIIIVLNILISISVSMLIFISGCRKSDEQHYYIQMVREFAGRIVK